jgi:hypothetical protein
MDLSVIPDDEREDGAWTDFIVWASSKTDQPKSVRVAWRTFRAGWHACHIRELLNQSASKETP